MSIVKRGIAFNNEANFYITDATEVVKYIKSRTEYSPQSLTALAKASMISGIMGLSQKSDGKTTTIINGQGPIGTILVSTNSNGTFKARCTNPLAFTESKNENVIGNNGFLRVIKDVGLKEPFTSDVELQNASLETNYTYYFSVSEQLPTAICSGVTFTDDLEVEKAGCLIIQLLPGATDDTINKIEKLFTKDIAIAKKLETESIDEILNNIFGDDYKILGESKLEFTCDCSQEKFQTAIQMLAPDEIIEIKQDPEIEVICDFCYKQYKIDTKDL